VTMRATAALWLGAIVLFAAVATATGAAQVATAERLEGQGWWPTKRGGAREDYVGASVCAACHQSQAASQSRSSMARTGDRAVDSDILRTRPSLTFAADRFSYTINRKGDQILYNVTDGGRSLSAPLAWAFGAGKVGQSFLFERSGQLHESRVSYYDSIQRLDVTPNHARDAALNLDAAASRVVPAAEVRRCFACHTTASGTGTGDVNFAELISGVTCEACHGPGRRHVAVMRTPASRRTDIGLLRVRGMSPADSVDLCGSCHATFWDVTLAGERGIAALRSQPFRLQSSRCWQQGDARLTCVACHDPHTPLVRDPRAYDARCTACHAPAAAGATHTPRVCAVAADNCTTCHMPKYEVPDMHFEFTDHTIRIVKKTG
jgi:hypothetical protein